MSWEIKGTVESASDVDALTAAPTEAPEQHEESQVAAVASALKALIDAGVVGGLLRVRAGGHANVSGGPEEGQAHEGVTLTVEYDVPPPPPQVVEDEGTPTWGTATSTEESPAEPQEHSFDADAEDAELVLDDDSEDDEG